MKFLKKICGLCQLPLPPKNPDSTYTLPLIENAPIILKELPPPHDSIAMSSALASGVPLNEPLLTRLLEANLFFQGTLGSVISITQTKNTITLYKECKLNSFEIFKNTLEDFANITEYWQKEIKKYLHSQPHDRRDT